MALGGQTSAHVPHAPLLNRTQFSRSITGTLGKAWGKGIYTEDLGRMPMSNSLGRGTSLCGKTLSSRFEPVGHTNVQAPQVMHASLFRSHGVSTRIPAPRPTKSAAPTPLRSRHTRTHRPQRMQSSCSFGNRGASTF